MIKHWRPDIRKSADVCRCFTVIEIFNKHKNKLFFILKPITQTITQIVQSGTFIARGNNYKFDEILVLEIINISNRSTIIIDSSCLLCSKPLHLVLMYDSYPCHRE